eukprot:1213161-Amphidinium_carterae.1
MDGEKEKKQEDSQVPETCFFPSPSTCTRADGKGLTFKEKEEEDEGEKEGLEEETQVRRHVRLQLSLSPSALSRVCFRGAYQRGLQEEEEEEAINADPGARGAPAASSVPTLSQVPVINFIAQGKETPTCTDLAQSKR